MAVSIVLAGCARDRRRALAFVRRHVRRTYGGIPPPSQIVLFAERNRRICGTIALDFADSSGRFPLEAIYSIDHSQTPWPFKREEIAQFGKWWTTLPGVAVRLMHAAHAHALAEGKSCGLVEVKPPIVARVAEFGMVLLEVPGAVLQIHGVSARGEGYYATLPLPQLYMFDIRANAAALTRYIELQYRK
ncbi:MAG TPA: hypothetical protein VF173_11150 [Thermoanaerobaculia bacterium]|nr:hypothetical protein [Thermoanaerobaculia bacterium]